MPRYSTTDDQLCWDIEEKVSVTPEGEWDFTGSDTQYLTHGLHPYLASMIPQLPHKLLQMYAAPTTRLLDPFAGGGTVLVEAALKGIEATGIDANPLASIISRAKTTPIPIHVLNSAAKLFDEAYSQAEAQIPDFPRGSNVAFWFKEYTFEPLGKVRSAMQELVRQSDGEFRKALENLLACVFSNTVRDVSLTYRGEVRLRRLQTNDYERFNPNVASAFRTRMLDAFSRVGRLPYSRSLPCMIEGDARHISAEDSFYDLVITSPPYGDMKNTIPYHQFSKNMLYWLGNGESDLRQLNSKALGLKTSNKIPPISATLREAIARMSKPNLIREAICFYADYWDALKEIARVTNQRIIVVIGHRILDGVQINNPDITTDFMQALGWQLEIRYQRTIRKKRINRKMGFGNNAQGGTIDSEAILVYVRDC